MKINLKETREIMKERAERKIISESGFESVNESGEYDLFIESISRKLSSSNNVYDEVTFATTDKTKRVKHRFFYTPASLPFLIEFYEQNGVKVEEDKNGDVDLELLSDFDGVVIRANVQVTEVIRKDKDGNEKSRVTPVIKEFLPVELPEVDEPTDE